MCMDDQATNNEVLISRDTLFSSACQILTDVNRGYEYRFFVLYARSVVNKTE